MQRYNFDYVRPMAEGIGVHAPDMDTALEAALMIANNGIKFEHERVKRLVFRDNQPCASRCKVCGVP